MSAISTSLRLNDNMTPVLNKMYNSLMRTNQGFRTMERTANSGVNINVYNQFNTKIEETKNKIKDVNSQQEKTDRNINKTSSSTSGWLSKVKGIVAAYASIQTLSKGIKLSDEMTLTTARLDLINDKMQSTDTLQRKIFSSAEASRSSYSDTAAVVSRLGLLAGDAFSSNDEMIKFSELMNKSFVVGGASDTEQTSAMYQLTQAMASGRLQGDEYRSIIENAPLLAQAIEDYMRNVEHAKGTMKDWASEGMLTAEVIKAAMFNSAEETEKRFENMPMTFSQIWTSFKNNALMAFQPVLQRLNALANSEKFEQFKNQAISLAVDVADKLLTVFDAVCQISDWISSNWSVIGPIVIGIAAAIAIYTAAQWALNIALNANPIMLIVTLVGLLIAGIIYLANKVGGFGVLWNYTWAAIKVGFYYCEAAVLSGFWWMVYGLYSAFDWLATGFENLRILIETILTGISNFFISIGAAIMLHIQEVINTAIDLLNSLIDALNYIPGVEIDAVGHVTFGDDIEEKARAKIAENNAELENKKSLVAKDRAEREKTREGLKDKAKSAWNDNVAKADETWDSAKQYAANERARQKEENKNNAVQGASLSDEYMNNTGTSLDNIDENTKKTSENTEDLKYLRDIAERDVINRFTTARIHVENTNHNNIDSNADVDGIVSGFGDKLAETVSVVAEGDYS